MHRLMIQGSRWPCLRRICIHGNIGWRDSGMLSKTRVQIGTVRRLVAPYFQSQDRTAVSLGLLGKLLVKES